MNAVLVANARSVRINDGRSLQGCILSTLPLGFQTRRGGRSGCHKRSKKRTNTYEARANREEMRPMCPFSLHAKSDSDKTLKNYIT